MSSDCHKKYPFYGKPYQCYRCAWLLIFFSKSPYSFWCWLSSREAKAVRKISAIFIPSNMSHH
ncbi:hypothetical protein DBR37_15080 [Herminiimonas sp. KBW02]|nr:hypothetical protein DBR37_15080 [Herminiimonas sp. KBW02]